MKTICQCLMTPAFITSLISHAVVAYWGIA